MWALRNRNAIIPLLKTLPEALSVEHEEVLTFLEAQHLYGHGIGWVDAHLLASTLVTGCAIWSFNKPLRRAAAALRSRVNFTTQIIAA
jgi:hypothetical protein